MSLEINIWKLDFSLISTPNFDILKYLLKGKEVAGEIFLLIPIKYFTLFVLLNSLNSWLLIVLSADQKWLFRYNSQ